MSDGIAAPRSKSTTSATQAWGWGHESICKMRQIHVENVLKYKVGHIVTCGIRHMKSSSWCGQ